MNLSNQQNTARKLVKEWFWNYRKNPKNTQQIFRLFGLAGTGKTTAIKVIVEELGVSVQFAAFAGKAALQMQKSGCHGASTIHSLIYKPMQDPVSGIVEFVLDRGSERLRQTQIIVVDECSMVDTSLGKDLESFGLPILVLGDPGQLPPVGGTGYFVDAEPDITLTEIHRQAADNPIIRLARAIREGELPSPGVYGDSEITKKGVRPSKEDFLDYDITLCGRNATRTKLNQTMRRFKGYYNESPDHPLEGERIIALRNDHQKGILNGTLYKVHREEYDRVGKNFSLDLVNLDFGNRDSFVKVRTRDDFFDGTDTSKLDWRILQNVNHFDWGYVLSVHKAQGSQWGSVLIFDESYCFREDWNRWLYTAITRASEKFKMVMT